MIVHRAEKGLGVSWPESPEESVPGLDDLIEAGENEEQRTPRPAPVMTQT